MTFGRNAYIGASEVSDLVGAWQQIVGASPWHQIVGAETYYPWYYQHPAPAAPPPAQRWPQYHRHHHRPRYGAGYGYPTTVRDHRRAQLYNAYVSGDPSAAQGLALMGAEDAAAAQTGVPPVDATMPAPPLPPGAVPPPAAAPPMPVAPPVPPPMPMGPPDGGDGAMMEHHHRHHHRHQGWGPPPGYGWEIPPRNAMVDYPGPSAANRIVLPVSSGVNILPNTSAQITARSQTVAFRPERLIIGGSPGDWIINDIKVGNLSQFAQSGDIPGEMFAATTIDSFVSFQTVQTAQDFVVLTTFVGASESGAPFVAGVLGTAAV